MIEQSFMLEEKIGSTKTVVVLSDGRLEISVRDEAERTSKTVEVSGRLFDLLVRCLEPER